MLVKQAKSFLTITTVYRIASVLLVLATINMGDLKPSLPKTTHILLALATIMLAFVYSNLYKNSKIVVGAIWLELVALLCLYTLAGGMGNPILWYLINPILFDLYFFYSRLKVFIYSLIFSLSSLLGSLYIHGAIVFTIENVSVMMFFVLVLLLIALLASYQKDLSLNMVTLKYAYSRIKKEIDRNDQTSNWLEESYKMFEKLLFEKNLYAGLEMIIKYASNALPCQGVNIYYQEELYGKDDDRYLPIKVELEDGCGDSYIVFLYDSSERSEIAQYINQMNIMAQMTSLFVSNITLMDRNNSLIVQNEQKRIAEEIHDGIQQQLMGTVFMLRGIVSNSRDLSIDDVMNHLDMIYKELNQAACNLKRTIYQMCDCKEVDKWLVALEEEAQLIAGHYGIDVVFNTRGTFKTSIETIYFKSMLRVLREGISNAINHGNADHIRVELTRDYDKIMISLIDNGKGFNLDGNRKYGMGLHNMGAIAETYNGDFNIESTLNLGTRVSVSMTIK